MAEKEQAVEQEVSEYRQRAEAAEKEAVRLAEEVARRQEAEGELQEKLRRAERENEIQGQLQRAGVTDAEVARLLVEKAMEGGKLEAKEAVEQLRRQRPGLFGKEEEGTGLGQPTAGIARRRADGKAALGQQAMKASQSGSRRDVQEYLRMRRVMR